MPMCSSCICPQVCAVSGCAAEKIAKQSQTPAESYRTRTIPVVSKNRRPTAIPVPKPKT